MLEAVHTDLVFTISLKRSTQILQLSTSWPADYPIFRRQLANCSTAVTYATGRHPPSGIGLALAHGHNSLPSEISLCLRQGLRLNQKTLSFIAAPAFAEPHYHGMSRAFRLSSAREQRISGRQEFKIVETDAPQAHWARILHHQKITCAAASVARRRASSKGESPPIPVHGLPSPPSAHVCFPTAHLKANECGIAVRSSGLRFC